MQELARRNPQALYTDLCRIKGQTVDICCLDVFCCAVAQAQRQQLLKKKSLITESKTRKRVMCMLFQI